MSLGVRLNMHVGAQQRQERCLLASATAVSGQANHDQQAYCATHDLTTTEKECPFVACLNSMARLYYLPASNQQWYHLLHGSED
jgi:hypothetical protein